MGSFGHPLRFGVVIEAAAGDPARAARLAAVAESVGLDLVAVEGDATSEGFDPWTTLSWVAGRTTTIGLLPVSLDPAEQPPAVTARAALSLDRLSDGRVSLALTTGHDTQQESVAQLAEAVDIVRGVLTPGAGGLDYRGDHFQAHVDAGPAAKHRIPLWLSGSGAKLLSLVGRSADGWLADLGTGDERALEDLRSGNSAIDLAAHFASRDAGDIARIVRVRGGFDAAGAADGFCHGEPARWVKDLAPLAVRDGVSTFLVTLADEAAIERFAAEVVPALRERVNADLGVELPTRWPRTAQARSRRAPGLDYDAIPEELAEIAVEPGDFDYARVRSTLFVTGTPALVLRPRTVDEAGSAVRFAAGTGLEIAVRSGGHGIGGRSTNDGGIVIDLARMNTVEVLDAGAGLVRVGAGAKWGQVAVALAPYGLALTSGDSPGVGVGGLALGGGIGFLGREDGLTIDRMRAATVVTADGSVLRASAEENPDLFWALRGAGANMGLVAEFEFEAAHRTDVGWAQLVVDASDLPGLIAGYGRVAQAAPRDTTAFFHVGPSAPNQPRVAQISVMVASSDPDQVRQRLVPFTELAPVYDVQAVIAPYAAIMGSLPDDEDGGGQQGGGELVSRSALVPELDAGVVTSLATMLERRVVWVVAIRAMGGAISDVPVGDTAFAHRDAGFQIFARGARLAQVDGAWDQLSQSAVGTYIGFDSDERPERINAAYPDLTLAKLREIKKTYDPRNLFHDNFDVALPRTRRPE
ncbi:LLM class flavin-dependent oxidoreductase [Tsukamurella spumae]|uniref:LLM class flavin-dependent oxidoreductase n=1 Tax=Tsukamurella spumae TaxID=44753 RepID=A0A846X3N6_9ACTN|nr:LLM class flavin-dependent oxidoreductase [Tsukamurella spumae]NKY19763.1 LLM class flavin-dependent oxidoreductase [Tsukamurella spumae]